MRFLKRKYRHLANILHRYLCTPTGPLQKVLSKGKKRRQQKCNWVFNKLQNFDWKLTTLDDYSRIACIFYCNLTWYRTIHDVRVCADHTSFYGIKLLKKSTKSTLITKSNRILATKEEKKKIMDSKKNKMTNLWGGCGNERRKNENKRLYLCLFFHLVLWNFSNNDFLL